MTGCAEVHRAVDVFIATALPWVMLKQSNPVVKIGYHVKRQIQVPVGKKLILSELLQEEVIYDVIGNHSIAGRQCDSAR